MLLTERNDAVKEYRRGLSIMIMADPHVDEYRREILQEVGKEEELVADAEGGALETDPKDNPNISIDRKCSTDSADLQDIPDELTQPLHDTFYSKLAVMASSRERVREQTIKKISVEILANESKFITTLRRLQWGRYLSYGSF